MSMLKVLLAVAIATTIGFAGGNVTVAEVVAVDNIETPSKFYVGGGYAYDEVTIGNSFEGNNNGFFIGAGYNVNEFVAIEGRYNEGIEDSASFVEAGVDLGDLSLSAVSLFVKPQYSFDDVKVYGLAGMSMTEIEFNSLNEKVLDWETSFAYGIGGAYSFGTDVEVFVDYTMLYDDGNEDIDGEISSVNVGVNYKF